MGEGEKKRLGRPPGGKKVEFLKVYRPNWATLVRDNMHDGNLTFHDVGVLFALAAFMGWEVGYLVNPGTNMPASEKELADYIGTSRPNLHKYVEDLEKKGLVAVKRQGGGRPNLIFINPHIVYFGKYAGVIDLPEFGWKPAVKVTRNKKIRREG